MLANHGQLGTKGVYTFDLSDLVFEITSQDDAQELDGWRFSNSGEIVQVCPGFASEQNQSQATPVAEVTQIKHVTLDAAITFENIVNDGLPVVLKGLSIGACVERWTLDYLSKQLGEDRKVCEVTNQDGGPRSSMAKS